MGDGSRLGLAVLLLMIGLGLLLTEFFVISFGALALAAAGCMIGSVLVAFQISTGAGLLFILPTIVSGWLLAGWGLARMKRSAAVVNDAITGDAGAHHLAGSLGIAAGATGVLVTDARPTGRARFALAGFPPGEVDVQVRGGLLKRGAAIVVLSTDGPVVLATPAPEPSSTAPNSLPNPNVPQEP
jgi:membrane-bound ClpP family serine protease